MRKESLLKWNDTVCRLMDASDWMEEILSKTCLDDPDQTKLQIIRRHMHHEFCELLESIDGTILQLGESDQIEV